MSSNRIHPAMSYYFPIPGSYQITLLTVIPKIIATDPRQKEYICEFTDYKVAEATMNWLSKKKLNYDFIGALVKAVNLPFNNVSGKDKFVMVFEESIFNELLEIMKVENKNIMSMQRGSLRSHLRPPTRWKKFKLAVSDAIDNMVDYFARENYLDDDDDEDEDDCGVVNVGGLSEHKSTPSSSKNVLKGMPKVSESKEASIAETLTTVSEFLEESQESDKNEAVAVIKDPSENNSSCEQKGARRNYYSY